MRSHMSYTLQPICVIRLLSTIRFAYDTTEMREADATSLILFPMKGLFSCTQCKLMSEGDLIVEYAHGKWMKVAEDLSNGEVPPPSVRHRWLHWRDQCLLNPLHSTVDYCTTPICRRSGAQVAQSRWSLWKIRPGVNVHWHLSRVRLQLNATVLQYAPIFNPVHLARHSASLPTLQNRIAGQSEKKT